MGQRGPNPYPVEIIKETTPSRGRALEKTAPMADGEKPVPPDWLAAAAVEIWNEKIGWLELRGMTDSGDRELLAVYCQTYADLVDTWKTLQAEGPTYTSELRNGSEIIHDRPEWKRLNDLKGRLLDLSRRFGFSPSDRAGLGLAVMRDPRAEAARKLEIVK